MSIGEINNPDLSNPTNTGKVLKFSEDRQTKIWQALADLHEKLGTNLASIYEGIILTFQGNNPEKISIICHLARELTDVLPKYVKGLPIRQKSEPDPDVAKELERIIGVLDLNDQKIDKEEKIREIVKNLSVHFHKEPSHGEKLRAIVDAHPVLSSRPEYLNKAFVKQWVAVHRYFVKNAHHQDLRNQNEVTNTESELRSNWSALEGLIHRILVSEPFFNAIVEIDRILAIPHPEDKDADELMVLIVEQEHRRYFFDKCTNPEWLELLNKNGAFSTPQEPVKRDKYIQFVGWPESQYLVRMAKQKPQEVYDIIKNLNSENQSVLDDFLDAALNSPSGIAARYVKLIKNNKWLQGVYSLRLPDKAADLMEKLASEGKEDDAISLARELFKLRIDALTRTSDNPNDLLSIIHPDAKPYFDEWRFGEIVQKKTGRLAIARPVELFETYASKLHSALVLEKRENAPDDFYEYSHIWRPNISRSRNRTEDAKNILIDGIISLIEQYKDDVSILKQFAEALHKHPYALFRRLEMFIFNQNPDEFLTDAETILKDKKIILAYNLRREYLPLLGTLFNKISVESQKEILDIIEAGPDVQKKEDQTQEQFDHLRADWKSLYLVPIKEHLPEKYKKMYEGIVVQYGESKDDDGEMTSWEGGKSPISSTDLNALALPEVIDYIGEYTDPEDPFEAFSSGGLGMAFANVVGENPEKYVSGGDLLLDKKVRPLFVYQFLNGLKEALTKERCFDWKPIVDLCHKIITSSTSDLPEPAGQREQDWHSVRRAMADLFGEALGKKHCEIPIELRKKVWTIVSTLLEDNEPSIDDEKRDGAGTLDPMTVAINSVRGEAMHAVVNYGLWLARQYNEKEAAVTKMPSEMQIALEDHLDPLKDASLAIRSVYGWRLPNLFYLNPEWVVKNLDLIFPREDALQAFFMAALEGYVSNQVYGGIFDALKKVYWHAVSLLGKNPDPTGYRAADIDERLPQHLMIVYIRDPKHDDLMDHFFANAPIKARAQAINFVGRVILREMQAYSDRDAVTYRVAQLWDGRTLACSTLDTEELQEFGWWFKQSPFTHKETIDRLIKTLKITNGIIDVAYEIIDELQNYATELPVETITALDSIAHAEREYHELTYKKDEYKEVIRRVKGTGNAEAISKANNLINFLGSKGFIDFRDLL